MTAHDSLGACTGPEAPLMRFRCPVACQTCEVLEYKHRCPIDRDHDWVLKKPGDLNAIFERISTDPFWKDHGPIDIISSPETGGPWLITLDNFISDEECERLIELGGEEGYERSLDFDDVTDDGSSTHIESTGRTSTNAWCPERCNTDPISGPVHRRIEKLVGSNYNNSENIQLLSYTSGQFYEAHHGKN
jgi:prolyl 4-hydroxylase